MSVSQKLQLLNNVGTDSAEFSIPLDGAYEWAIEGAFGGGSYQMQATAPNGTFTNVAGASMSTAGWMRIWFTRGTKVKLVKTGAVANMYSTLIGPVR